MSGAGKGILGVVSIKTVWKPHLAQPVAASELNKYGVLTPATSLIAMGGIRQEVAGATAGSTL